MSNEAQVILDVWEAMRDHVPHAKRSAIAQDILYAFEEYGFEGTDCASILDEDPDLAAAYHVVFPDEEDSEEDEP